MFRRILVPLDGSDVAAQVLPYVRRIAKAGEHPRVDLLEAIPAASKEYLANATSEAALPYVIPMPAHVPTQQRFDVEREQLRTTAQRRLEYVAQELRQAGIKVDVYVDDQDPFEAIVAQARRDRDTLIAMTTHGRSGIGRWLMGSVTDKVVRHGEHPTLVVRASKAASSSDEAQLSGIVLPLDGSETSSVAIPYATALARDLGLGATLIRVLTPLSHTYTWGESVPPDYDELDRQAVQNCQLYLDYVADKMRGEGVRDVQTKVVDGNPGTTIVDEVGELGTKLVVMATHGRAGVGRWVLGSVADRVIRQGHGPVLAIRPVGVPASVSAA